MLWGVKNTFFEAPGVSLGGSGVSIGGVKILRVGVFIFYIYLRTTPHPGCQSPPGV